MTASEHPVLDNEVNLGRTEINLVTSNKLYFSYFYQTIYVKTKVNFVLFILLETRLTKLK